jgi:DNA-directed RNA polymerase specialized sigma24 family protein
MTDQEFQQYVGANYDRFLAFVRGYVRPPLEAQDVLQDALLGLWSRRDHIDAQAPGGYFFRSLHNGVVSSWRFHSRHPGSSLSEEGLADPRSTNADSDPPSAVADHPDPLAVALAACTRQPRGATAEAIAAVEDACILVLQGIRAEMTDQQRDVFAAYLQSGGSQSKAQALLDLPSPSTYPNALHKAKNLIRGVLAPHRDALLHVLGAVQVRELLFIIFCDGPQGPPSEEES